MGRHATLGAGVLDYLMSYDFPGNIRELENLIEQGVALAQDGQLHLNDIAPNSNGNEFVEPRPGLATRRRPGEFRGLARVVRKCILNESDDFAHYGSRRGTRSAPLRSWDSARRRSGAR